MASIYDLVQIGEPLTTARRNIPYLMLHEKGQSVKERWEPTVVNVGFTAIVAWDQADDWIVDMIGEHLPLGSGSIMRFNPEPHPFYPNLLYCQGLNLLRGDGRLGMDEDVEGGLSYDFAVYECNFLPVAYTLGSDAAAEADPRGELSRYVIRDRKSTGESIQTSGNFVFPSGGPPYTTPVAGVPVNTPPTIQTAVGMLEYTWLYVPDPIDYLLDQADLAYGYTNAAEFDGIHAVDTLLFLGAEPTRIPLSPGGNALWNVKFKFGKRRQTWQVAYRPSVDAPPGDWSPIINRMSGAPPYGRVDLQKLFSLYPGIFT